MKTIVFGVGGGGKRGEKLDIRVSDVVCMVVVGGREGRKRGERSIEIMNTIVWR